MQLCSCCSQSIIYLQAFSPAAELRSRLLLKIKSDNGYLNMIKISGHAKVIEVNSFLPINK